MTFEQTMREIRSVRMDGIDWFVIYVEGGFLRCRWIWESTGGDEPRQERYLYVEATPPAGFYHASCLGGFDPEVVVRKAFDFLKQEGVENECVC